MKFFLAASLIFLSVRTETQAFSPIHRQQPKPTFPLHASATQPEDVYNSVLNNLNGLSSIDRAPPALTTTTQEPAQQSLLDALTSASDAANAAAAASARLSSDLGSSIDIPSSSPLLSPEAIATAQTKLSILQQNLVTSADPSTYSRAIAEALDASIHASEHTLASTNILLENLLHFDRVMAHSMELYQTQQHFHLIPVESWQVAQEKLTLLIHNLSHGGLTFEGIGRSETEWLDSYLAVNAGAGSGWSLQTYDEELFRGVFAEMDRKLDLLPQLLGQNGFGVSAEGSVDVSAVSTMIMYGTLALVVGYSQRQSGVESYKSEIRRKLESGGYDINQLAKDVGLPENAAASINTQVERILDESEPAIANAAASTSMKSLNLKEETLAEDPAVLEDPALAMAAMGDSANSPPDADPQQLIANTSMKTAVKETLEERKEVEKILTSKAPIPKPPKEEPALSLMAAAIDVLSPTVNDDVKPEQHALSTIMASEQDAEKSNDNIVIELEQTLPQTKKVNVVTSKTQSSKPKSKSNPKPKANLPPASPLARLLAEELGLELTSIGKGSGKNGKILIDDVRRFQARLEEAKRSITNVGSYFATVNA